MLKDQVSWWHTCVISNWFILLEYFPKNAIQYALARIAVSDGVRAWEGMFSADEIAAMTRTSRKVLEHIRESSALGLERQLNVSTTHLGDHAKLVFSDSEGQRTVLEMKNEINTSEFIGRAVVYDVNLHANVDLSDKKQRELEDERDGFERNVNNVVKKISSFEDTLVHGVKVLMQEKLDRAELQTSHRPDILL